MELVVVETNLMNVRGDCSPPVCCALVSSSTEKDVEYNDDASCFSTPSSSFWEG